jgi:hypothetical protein
MGVCVCVSVCDSVWVCVCECVRHLEYQANLFPFQFFVKITIIVDECFSIGVLDDWIFAIFVLEFVLVLLYRDILAHIF